jgi:hypothetical protein
MGEGWGEGEESRNFNKLFIPPHHPLPSRQRVEGKFYFIREHQTLGTQNSIFPQKPVEKMWIIFRKNPLN